MKEEDLSLSHCSHSAKIGKRDHERIDKARVYEEKREGPLFCPLLPFKTSEPPSPFTLSILQLEVSSPAVNLHRKRGAWRLLLLCHFSFCKFFDGMKTQSKTYELWSWNPALALIAKSHIKESLIASPWWKTDNLEQTSTALQQRLTGLSSSSSIHASSYPPALCAQVINPPFRFSFQCTLGPPSPSLHYLLLSPSYP